MPCPDDIKVRGRQGARWPEFREEKQDRRHRRRRHDVRGRRKTSAGASCAPSNTARVSSCASRPISPAAPRGDPPLVRGPACGRSSATSATLEKTRIPLRLARPNTARWASLSQTTAGTNMKRIGLSLSCRSWLVFGRRDAGNTAVRKGVARRRARRALPGTRARVRAARSLVAPCVAPHSSTARAGAFNAHGLGRGIPPMATARRPGYGARPITVYARFRLRLGSASRLRLRAYGVRPSRAMGWHGAPRVWIGASTAAPYPGGTDAGSWVWSGTTCLKTDFWARQLLEHAADATLSDRDLCRATARNGLRARLRLRREPTF